MDTVTRHSREFWKDTYRELDRSGLPVDAFARIHGLNPKTLRWWVSTLKRERRSESKATQFLPVELAPDAADSADAHVAGVSVDVFEIVLPRGTTVRVPIAADTSRLKDLLHAVLGAGC